MSMALGKGASNSISHELALYTSKHMTKPPAQQLTAPPPSNNLPSPHCPFSSLDPPSNKIRRGAGITAIREMRGQDSRGARTDEIAGIAEDFDIGGVGVRDRVVTIGVAEKHDRADVGGFVRAELRHCLGRDLSALPI
jgi:hypothetical protein